MSFNKRILSAGVPEPFAEQNFKHITYTGNDGTGHAITGVGFKPDLIMIKPRNQTENWNIYDSTRGATKQLLPNTGAAESTQGNTVQSFDTDGFTLNGDNNVNKDGINYSAWCWKANGGTTSSNSTGDITSTVQANTAAGFSIVKYTGNGSATQTIGHGLNSAPEWMVVKRLNSSNDWVWKNDTQLGAARGMYFNDSGCEVTDSTFWQSASPTSSVFTVGTSDKTNGNGDSYIAYCWHSVSEFSNSTTGSQYTGTGNSDGPTINLGFEPSIIIIKSKDCGTGQAQNWLIYTQDTNEYLSIDNTNQAASSSGTYKIDFLSNGFKVSGSGSGINSSGRSYNYYCWAKNPDEEAPTLANSFNIETWTGNGIARNIDLGFQPNFAWIKSRSYARNHYLYDNIRGADNQLLTNAVDAQANNSQRLTAFNTDSFSLGTSAEVNNSGETYVAWSWKANDNEPTYNTNGTINSIVSVNANAGFSVIKYTGTGSNATVGHGLSAAPTFMIVKNLSSSSAWAVFHTSLGATKYMALNETTAVATASNVWNDTAPASTVASIGTWGPVNTSGDEHIMYAWDDVSGYSKIGSYSGTGSALNITGVGFKPDFLIIKDTGSTEQWYMFDSRRGHSKFLHPNLSNTEGTDATARLTAFGSDGFSLGTDGAVNTNGNTYIYAAFAKNVASNTTLANSFKAVIYDGNGASNRQITGVGFRPDLVWIKRRSASRDHYLFDSVRGTAGLYANLTNAEFTATVNDFNSFDSDGFTVGQDNNTNSNNNTMVAWCWKAGNTWQHNITGDINSTVNVNTANGFSIVKYHGNSASSATIGHGLSSAPQLIITKPLNLTAGWPTQYNDGSTTFYGLRLNETGANDTNNGNVFYANTAPTSSVYTVGGSDEVNDDYDYIAYCFHSVSGFCKIGTYTGTGTSSRSFTGVGFQPDFLMIKCTSATAGWHMYDHARGIKKRLKANDSGAEYDEATGGSAGVNSFDTDGWTIGNDTDLNGNNETFIYVAFKAN